MIVKTNNIQAISIMKAFLCVILFILRFIKKIPPPKISKREEVIHNMTQKQLLTIFKSFLNRYTEQKKKGILNLVLNYAFFI